MKVFFALFPLLSLFLLFLFYQEKVKSAIALSGLFSLIGLLVGEHQGLRIFGGLDALLFYGIAFFPLLVQKRTEKIAEGYRQLGLSLESECLVKESQYEQWGKNRKNLEGELEHIVKRYAFAKALVSQTEKKAILSELASIFLAEKKVWGLSFSTSIAASSEPSLPDERKAPTLIFASGSISENGWEKILQTVSIPERSVSQHPFSLRLLQEEKRVDESEQAVFASVPVSWVGEVQGSLNFVLDEPAPQEFLNEVSVYAQLLGIGLHKASLYQRMIEHSRRDGLTNLYLRRIFLERLREEISFTKRYGTSFSVLMLDLDHFKLVNDHYGHLVGDTVLKAVAKCLLTTLHPGVMVCRYGGEEFAILVGLAPNEEVMQIAEKIRQAVESMRIVFAEQIIQVSVSIGVAHFLPDAPAPEALMSRADNALYRAKDAGRNCVREWHTIQ